MPKPPAANLEHLGATIDALATTNAMMFMLLASQGQSDAALRLLDRMAKIPAGDDPVGNGLRATVADATAKAIRGLRELDGASAPIGLPAMR